MTENKEGFDPIMGDPATAAPPGAPGGSYLGSRPIIHAAALDKVTKQANALATKVGLCDEDLKEDAFMLRLFLVQALRLPGQHGYRYAKELLDISRGEKKTAPAKPEGYDDLPTSITDRL